jgi:hypothetical protein
MIFRDTLAAIALVAFVCVAALGQAPKSTRLPRGILAANENAYCEQFLADRKKNCHHDFRVNLLWRQLKIAPSRTAILVENRNRGACGSAGCSLYLFIQQPDARFAQILGTGSETGKLDEISILKNMTGDHFNLQKTWRDGRTQTLYQWNGVRYIAGVTWSPRL